MTFEDDQERRIIDLGKAYEHYLYSDEGLVAFATLEDQLVEELKEAREERVALAIWRRLRTIEDIKSVARRNVQDGAVAKSRVERRQTGQGPASAPLLAEDRKQLSGFPEGDAPLAGDAPRAGETATEAATAKRYKRSEDRKD